MEAQGRAIEIEPDGAVLMLGGNVAGEILSHLEAYKKRHTFFAFLMCCFALVCFVHLVSNQRQIAETRDHQIEGFWLDADYFFAVSLEANANLSLPYHAEHLPIVCHRLFINILHNLHFSSISKLLFLPFTVDISEQTAVGWQR